MSSTIYRIYGEVSPDQICTSSIFTDKRALHWVTHSILGLVYIKKEMSDYDMIQCLQRIFSICRFNGEEIQCWATAELLAGRWNFAATVSFQWISGCHLFHIFLATSFIFFWPPLSYFLGHLFHISLTTSITFHILYRALGRPKKTLFYFPSSQVPQLYNFVKKKLTHKISKL